MAIFKCKMCGGNLVLTEGSPLAECEYCGSMQTVPAADNEKKMTLFSRAHRLRFGCEFDKAFGIYEALVADFPKEAEAYWGLLLCKYGIEYVDDPKTGKKIPTCHRSNFESVIEDPNFKQVLENSDPLARRVYEEEAQQIEELRKGILEVSGKEAPFDIFICYKETDSSGQRTLDSVLAQDMYDALTEKGYRVFFSRITLEDKLGQEYEPYIFAALNSAKVMLVIGTDPDYFDAVWVRNEWSRYLKLMETNHSKHLIPCYKSLDAYDMPKEFSKLQAQDMGKVGAMQDLLRGVDKLIAVPTVTTTQTAQNSSIPTLLGMGNEALDKGNWAIASKQFDLALVADPKCAEAYVGLLLVSMKLKHREQLAKSKGLKKNYNYQRAVEYANDSLKEELEGYRKESERITKRNRKIVITSTSSVCTAVALVLLMTYVVVPYVITPFAKYNKAIQLMDNSQYADALAVYKEQVDYKDQENLDKVKDLMYNKGTDFASSEKYTEAVQVFASLDNYKDSADLKDKFQLYVDYAKATTCWSNGDLEQSYESFKQLEGFKDSTEKAEEVRREIVKKSLQNIKVGDCIKFGEYHGITEWLVLEVKDGKAFVVSNDVLTNWPYHNVRIAITWENCHLRQWLNEKFINSTFSEEEKAMISLVTVPADRSPTSSVADPGNATQDKVFLLSKTEVEKYLNPIQKSAAKKKGSSASWWVRTPGKYGKTAVYVNKKGMLENNGQDVNTSEMGVRPAMWIDLNAD